MKVVIKSTKRAAVAVKFSPHTAALLAAPAKSGDNGALVWEVGSGYALTAQEIDALRRAAAPHAPNLERAAAVKRLMRQGLKRVDIVAKMTREYRGRRGFGERVISGDHATLSKVGEGVKK